VSEAGDGAVNGRISGGADEVDGDGEVEDFEDDFGFVVVVVDFRRVVVVVDFFLAVVGVVDGCTVAALWDTTGDRWAISTGVVVVVGSGGRSSAKLGRDVDRLADRLARAGPSRAASSNDDGDASLRDASRRVPGL
jgi:hypothetical protein